MAKKPPPRKNTDPKPKGDKLKGLRQNWGKGRPKGAKNHGTLEAKDFCSKLIDDPAYQRNFRARFVAGDLPPALEAMVWHYGKGKPPETMTHKITFDHEKYLADEPPDEE